MSDHFPAQNARGGEASRGLRITALIAVIAGVLVLGAAAFVLSYPGIHALALQTGVSRSLARVYPLIIDAMLVVACAAVLSMRGAGLVSRVFAWLSLLALLAAAAIADALHATAATLPARPAAAVFAVLPWALALIAFGLLIAMLRQARARWLMAAGNGHAGRRNGPGAQLSATAEGESPAHWQASRDWQPAAQPAMPALAAAPDQPQARRLAGLEAAPEAPARAGRLAGPAAPAAQAVPAAQAGPEAPEHASQGPAGDLENEPAGYQHASPDLAIDAEPAPDDPSSDETSPAVTSAGPWPPADQPLDFVHDDQAGEDDSKSVTALSPATADDPAPGDPAPEPGLPVFHRVRSLPTPPGEE